VLLIKAVVFVFAGNVTKKFGPAVLSEPKFSIAMDLLPCVAL
jgi:hypothetical protein